MGNRAVITFDEKPTDNSVGIYLHWNGGPESVVAFMDAADHYKIRGNNHNAYQVARVAQLIANFFGGTCSVGVESLANLNTDNGDNGVFIVKRGEGATEIRHIPSGNLAEKGLILMLDAIRTHPYFQPDKDGETILTKIYAANDAHFKDPVTT